MAEIHGLNWDRPILLGSAPSSGSTLLSVMLNAHPEVMCGPELSLFSHPFFWMGEGKAWADQMESWLDPACDEHVSPGWRWRDGSGVCPFVNIIYPSALDWYQVALETVRTEVRKTQSPKAVVQEIMGPRLRLSGKRFWAEKSPPNVYAFKSFLNRYPQGRGIIIVRDGRDVICSLLDRGWDFWRAISNWLVETALAKYFSTHPRVFILRYEDLVANAAEPLTRMCQFLGLDDGVQQMLDYGIHSDRVQNDTTILMKTWKSRPNEPIQATSVGRWKTELTSTHLHVLSHARVLPGRPGLEECGDIGFVELLEFFGYTTKGFDDAARSTDSWNVMQSLLPPALPLSFPMSEVAIPISASPQMLATMVCWSWGQVRDLQKANEALLVALSKKEEEAAELQRANAALQHIVMRKSGKVGGLRELIGWNGGVDRMLLSISEKQAS